MNNIHYSLWSRNLIDEESYYLHNPSGCYEGFLKDVELWEKEFVQFCEENYSNPNYVIYTL